MLLELKMKQVIINLRQPMTINNLVTQQQCGDINKKCYCSNKNTSKHCGKSIIIIKKKVPHFI